MEETNSCYASDLLNSTDLNESDSKNLKISNNHNIKISPAVGYKSKERKVSDISSDLNTVPNHGAMSFKYNRKDIILNLNPNSQSRDNNINDKTTILQEAMYYKRLANECSNKKNYSKSIEFYKKSLQCLSVGEPNTSCSDGSNSGELNKKTNDNYNKDFLNQSSVQNLKLDCLNNMAICYLLKKEFKKALDYTGQVSFLIINLSL